MNGGRLGAMPFRPSAQLGEGLIHTIGDAVETHPPREDGTPNPAGTESLAPVHTQLALLGAGAGLPGGAADGAEGGLVEALPVPAGRAGRLRRPALRPARAAPADLVSAGAGRQAQILKHMII